jgi:hypothetical protein
MSSPILDIPVFTQCNTGTTNFLSKPSLFHHAEILHKNKEMRVYLFSFYNNTYSHMRIFLISLCVSHSVILTPCVHKGRKIYPLILAQLTWHQLFRRSWLRNMCLRLAAIRHLSSVICYLDSQQVYKIGEKIQCTLLVTSFYLARFHHQMIDVHVEWEKKPAFI